MNKKPDSWTAEIDRKSPYKKLNFDYGGQILMTDTQYIISKSGKCVPIVGRLPWPSKEQLVIPTHAY